MSEESDYGGDVRWMNVDTETDRAEVRTTTLVPSKRAS